MVKRRKILVSAYGCEPFRGSEAGVGWNWVIQMAQENELHVITRRNDKEKIEKNIPLNLRDSLHFYYYDTCDILKKVKNKEKGLYLYYWFWQIGIIRIILRLIKRIDFDYSMHLSFGSLWMPTFLPFFNIPFIWGPLGGGDAVPKAYLKQFPLKQRFIQSFRYVLIYTAKYNPLIFIPCQKAVSILVRTENNRDVIPKRYQHKVSLILETAMESDIFQYEKKTNNTEKINIILLGRLVPFKNVGMSIDIMKNIVINHNVHLTIIGKGSEKNNIYNKIIEYQLQEHITLIDELTRSEALMKLQEGDIYLFPSLREGGSWALMEGMAIGLPVVCFNWTGMKVITDSTCAIRITPSNYKKSVLDFTEAINYLIEHPDIRIQMGQAARLRIKEIYTWEQKGKFMTELFNQLDRS